MARIREAGERFAERELPPSVAGVVSDQVFVVDTPQFLVSPLPGVDPRHPFPTFLRLRYQQGIEDRLTLVAGTMPQPQDRVPMLIGQGCPEDTASREEFVDWLETATDEEKAEVACELRDLRHFQVVVTEETATDMGLMIGEQTVLTPDPTDPLLFGLSARDLDFALIVSISGIVELADVAEEYWYGDPDLHRPRIQENADLRIIYATGLIDPRDFSEITRSIGLADRRHTWRLYVDPALVALAHLDTLEVELRAFENHFAPIAARPSDFAVITGLSDLIEDHLEQREQTIAMLSTSVAGVLSIVVAVVLLLAVLMNERQRYATVLTRNRGASTGQLTLTRAYEGLVLTAPAVAIGYYMAGWVIPETDYLFSYRVSVALAVGAILAIVGAALPLIRRRLGSLQKERATTSTLSPRGQVGLALVIVLAYGAIVLLRRRGQIESTSSGGIDLLLATAPAVVTVAIGLITLQLYPLAIAALAWIGSKTRGLVAFVGFQRIRQQDLAGRLPVLVVLICVSAASFASVARATILSGQEKSSWQAVGADIAIKGHGPHVPLPNSIDLTAIDGIEGVAMGATFANARAKLDLGTTTAEVLAIDAAAYGELTSGTAGDSALPAFLLHPPEAADGTVTSPIPVVVSSRWPTSTPVELNDVFTVDLGVSSPIVVVKEIRDRHPDLVESRPFIIMDLETLRSSRELPIHPTVAYLRASQTAGDGIQMTVSSQSRSARVLSRYQYLDTVAGDPFISWVDRGLLIVFGFAVALAIVAAISSLALTSATRRRDFRYLRITGLSQDQATAMTVIEQFPAVVVAGVVGVLTGAVVAWAFDPAIDFDSFTGGLVPANLEIDWLAMAGTAVALIAAMAVAVGIFVTVNRGEDLARTLRMGDE